MEVRRGAEARVEQDPQRLADRGDPAGGELGVVGFGGADAGEDRAGAGAKMMRVGAGVFAGYPLAEPRTPARFGRPSWRRF